MTWWRLEELEQPAGEVTLQASLDLSWRLALGGAAGDVGACWGVVGHARQDDGVQSPVELPVTTTVEAVADDLARRRLNRGGPAEHGESGLRTEPTRVRPGSQQLRGADYPDARLGQQPCGGPTDERVELGLEIDRRPRPGGRARAGRCGAARWSWRDARSAGSGACAGDHSGPAVGQSSACAAARAGARVRWPPAPSGWLIAQVRARIALWRVVSSTRIASRSPRRRGWAKWSRPSASRAARTASRSSVFAPLRRAGRAGRSISTTHWPCWSR